MSRNPKPTAEELRFVYRLILSGYDDSDVLAEYGRLYEEGRLMFPYRTDRRFIRECRRSLETALEVGREHLEKNANPAVVKRREEHFAELSSIAKALLANGLDSVSCPGWFTGGSSQVKHVRPNENTASGYDEMTNEDLSGQLNCNITAISKDSDWFFRHCFVPHLKSELPQELATEPLFSVVDEKPYEIIETLRIVAARGMLKGNCPVCKDWLQVLADSRR